MLRNNGKQSKQHVAFLVQIFALSQLQRQRGFGVVFERLQQINNELVMSELGASSEAVSDHWDQETVQMMLNRVADVPIEHID